MRRIGIVPDIVPIIRKALTNLVLAGAALMTGAARPVAPFAHEPLNVADACLVESIYFYDRCRERLGDDVWVRVLQWGAKEDDEVVAGHAVAVFAYADQLWAWDVNFGFLRLGLPAALRDDMDQVARPILAKYPRITPRDPVYRFDFPQPAAAGSFPETGPDEDVVVRDATIVANQLGRHRPVNLVEFAYLENGERRRGAAVVFLFHGRFCVYSPPRGTVPFHARGSVQNLRLVQEALRRMFPGAFAVKALRGG